MKSGDVASGKCPRRVDGGFEAIGTSREVAKALKFNEGAEAGKPAFLKTWKGHGKCAENLPKNPKIGVANREVAAAETAGEKLQFSARFLGLSGCRISKNMARRPARGSSWSAGYVAFAGETGSGERAPKNPFSCPQVFPFFWQYNSHKTGCCFMMEEFQ